MQIDPKNFDVNEAWLIGRLCAVEITNHESIDIYLLMDVASGYIFGNLSVAGETPSQKEIKALFKKARKAKKSWPKKLILPKMDPATELFQTIAEQAGFPTEVLPAAYFESIIKPIQQGFDRFNQPDAFSGPNDLEEYQETRAMIPDTYDPCSCSSGKKYKFCCKPIFHEIVEAMCACEDGKQQEALDWLEKAKSKVGETAEVLCRYAIVYGSVSDAKFHEYLKKTLVINPKHPRAHYLLGCDHAKNERHEEAIISYERAIECYPKTDKYHLNETWNNLANAYFNRLRIEDAKGAWEKALIYSPKDALTKSNLHRFIYDNNEIPADLRKPSPFVERLLKKD